MTEHAEHGGAVVFGSLQSFKWFAQRSRAETVGRGSFLGRFAEWGRHIEGARKIGTVSQGVWTNFAKYAAAPWNRMCSGMRNLYTDVTQHVHSSRHHPLISMVKIPECAEFPAFPEGMRNTECIPQMSSPLPGPIANASGQAISPGVEGNRGIRCQVSRLA